MNLSQLQEGVWRRLGVLSSDGTHTVNVVTDNINDALRQVATEHDWPWLQGEETLLTEAGVGDVAPGDSGWTGTTQVTITVGSTTTPLDRRTRDELDDMYQTGQEGQPAHWAVYGEVLVLRPIPDRAYTLTHRYVHAERVLTTGGSPFLPDAYAPAVCDLAVTLALSASAEDSRAVAAQRRYDGWLAKIADNRRRDRRSGRIRIRPGSQI